VGGSGGNGCAVCRGLALSKHAESGGRGGRPERLINHAEFIQGPQREAESCTRTDGDRDALVPIEEMVCRLLLARGWRKREGVFSLVHSLCDSESGAESREVWDDCTAVVLGLPVRRRC
jgi:hypothetical protein